MKFLVLEDDAMLPCDKNSQKVKTIKVILIFLKSSLFMLKIWKSGKETKGYYNQFGFEPNFETLRIQDNYKGYNLEQYRKDMHDISQFSLSRLQFNINKVIL